MKKTTYLLMLLAIITFGCSNPKQETAAEAKQDEVKINYTKQDLKKISWIEGNWRGTYDGKYFYELYRFTNDTTLEIISYEWNGQDSSHTSRSYVRWADNAYFLGAEKNYQVTEIGEDRIYMLPVNKASNDILWSAKDSNSWEAVLKASGKQNKYLMERVETF